ncbi:hypothetical protein N0V90_009604 [Kalmusia sp. IMI 367209]|nr:hypothetical protein N0V90_009604 [Kalmusia sp. IMI 367209]
MAHLSTGNLSTVTSHRSLRQHAGPLSTIHSKSDLSALPSPAFINSPVFSPIHPQYLLSAYSHATLAPKPEQHYNPGPFETVCQHCGLDPSQFFPTHPWATHHHWWTEIGEEYTRIKPYIEWQRKEKYRRKIRKEKQKKEDKENTIADNRYDYRVHNHRVIHWRTKKYLIDREQKVEKRRRKKDGRRGENKEKRKEKLERKDKKRKGKKEKQQKKLELKDKFITASRLRTGPEQDDRDAQGHEARQELVRELEARTDGEPADSPDARDRFGRLVGKFKDKTNARTIYGPTRSLDVITYGSTSSRKIAAAIVEHSPSGRSYVHCCSAKEDTRLAALEHLLVIQEDIMHRLMDREGITSSGWLPATAQAQHARAFGSMSDISTSAHIPPSHHLPSNAPSSAPSKAPSPSISSVPSQPQPHRPGRVQWLMGSES